MATLYADFDLASGANDGSSWGDAWRTMADVIAGTNSSAPAAGDEVLCRNTNDITATNAMTLQGSAASGYIKFIGVGGGGTNVGGSTRAVIDGQKNNVIGLELNNADFLWFENFEIKNCGSAGIANHGVSCITANSDHLVFINCISHDNYGNGFSGNTLSYYSHFYKCSAYNNSGRGWYNWRYGVLFYCSSHDNTYEGFALYSNTAKGCIAWDNGTYGFYSYSENMDTNCVAHSNTGKGFYYPYASVANANEGCRSTDNSVGVEQTTSGIQKLFYYYGDNNTADTGGTYKSILNDGNTTVTLNGSDTNFGYTDYANDDFSLTSSATYRRSAIAIPS